MVFAVQVLQAGKYRSLKPAAPRSCGRSGQIVNPGKERHGASHQSACRVHGYPMADDWSAPCLLYHLSFEARSPPGRHGTLDAWNPDRRLCVAQSSEPIDIGVL